EDGSSDEREGADGSSDSGDEGTTDTGEALPGGADLATETLPVTAEDAWDIALDATGGGGGSSLASDVHDGSGGWEMEIQLDGEEHELDIDATTGEVTDHDREADDDREPAVDITSPMTYQEAIEIALGEQDGRVEGWELDSDDG